MNTLLDFCEKIKTDKSLKWFYRSAYDTPFSCDCWMSLSDKISMDKESLVAFLGRAPNWALIKGVWYSYEETYVNFRKKWRLFKTSWSNVEEVTPKIETSYIWDGWKWNQYNGASVPQGTILRFIDEVFEDGTIKHIYCVKEENAWKSTTIEFVHFVPNRSKIFSLPKT